MRHYSARQKVDDGKWHYTCGSRPTGACGEFRTCTRCHGRGCEYCLDGVVRVREPCPGHDTAAEAYEHQKQYLLDNRLRFEPDKDDPRQLHRCDVEGCKVFTSGSASVGPYQFWPLCKDHRTREVVEQLLTVGESWES